MSSKESRFPTAYTILIIIIALVAVLTWIIPTGSYNYVVDGTHHIIKAAQVASYTGDARLLPIPHTYTAMPRHPQGIFAIFQAPIQGFYSAVEISFFVICIGGFLGLVMKTGAMDAGIAKVVEVLKGKEKFLIIILVILFSLGGTSFGMCEETIPFYLLLIPVLIASGYDSVTAVLTISLGTATGCLASTVNPFATGIASKFAGVSLGDGFFLRVFMLVLFDIVTIIFILRYASRVKKNPSHSIVANQLEDDRNYFLNQKSAEEFPEFTPKRKVVMTLFVLTFVIMVYGILPFNEIGLGFLPTLGWSFQEMTTLFLVMAVITGFVYGMKEKEIVSNFLIGACELLGVAIVIGIARGITIIMQQGLINDTLLHWAEQIASNFDSSVFIIMIFLLHIVLAFFIPSTSGLATISMPIFAPLAAFHHIAPSLVVTAYQSASGLVNYVTPTSAVVMGGLLIARVPYPKFLKLMIPYLLIIAVLIMIILGVFAVV